MCFLMFSFETSCFHFDKEMLAVHNGNSSERREKKTTRFVLSYCLFFLCASFFILTMKCLPKSVVARLRVFIFVSVVSCVFILYGMKWEWLPAVVVRVPFIKTFNRL